MRHPSNNELVERKIEVHKDQSLKEAIQEAHAVGCIMYRLLSSLYCQMYPGSGPLSIGARGTL